jgi:hypothetical protein
MSEIQLLEASLTGGILNANFVNGQLLTAEDLRAAQSANWEEHQELGRAAGTGVAYGFDVTVAGSSAANRPVLHVTCGLAINGKGELVLLGSDVDVVLTKTTATPASNGSVFAPCLPPQLQTALTNVGVYVLTVMPASGYQQMRPVAELGSDGVGTSCGSRYIVEGAKFRLVQLDLSAALNVPPARAAAAQLVPGIDANLSLLARSSGSQASTLQTQITADLNKLRNIVAYLCYGTDALAGFPADAFTRNLDATSTYTSYGVLDELADQKILQPCEVPLAALFWTSSGLQFVDRWGVRRRLMRQTTSAQWPLPLSFRRTAEAEAAFLQFQEQAEFLFGSFTQPALAGVTATAFFRFLPPCAFLPVSGNGSAKGFDPRTFFGSLSPGTAVTTISGAKLGKLLADSWLHRPVALTGKAMLDLYQVRENLDAVNSGASSQLYLIFASREMQDIAEDDAVHGAFQDAWEAYRGLVKKRAFLPTDATGDAIGARIGIVAAIQDVMAVASQKSTLAAAGRLNYDNALSAFNDLYLIQKEMAAYFASSIPGAPDTSRQSFAATLLAYLDVLIPPGITALLPALNAQDLPAAIVAQGAINNVVGTASGEGAALGNIFITNTGQNSANLVPGSKTPFSLNYTVANGTDRTLTIQLQATVTAPHGTWTGVAQFHDATGKPITSVTLASQVNQNVTLDILAPGDAQIGETATINVLVTVGPPHNKQNTDTRTAPIAGTGGTGSSQTVTFTSVVIPGGDLNNVAPAAVLTYIFNVRYAATAGPASATFNLHVAMTALPAANTVEWKAFALNANSGTTGVLDAGGLVLHAADTQDTQITLRISTPPARDAVADKTVSFDVTISSTDLPAVIKDSKTNFALRLAHA